jgi:hypothetical protein
MYRAESYEAAFAWALVGGLLIGFHAYVNDCVLLLLAWCLLRTPNVQPGLRIPFLIATLPFVYIVFFLSEAYKGVLPLTLIGCLLAGAITPRHANAQSD